MSPRKNAAVQTKVKAFLNTLISYGVVGFRVDAAKEIPQADFAAIFGALNTNYHGSKAFISQEIMYSFGSDNTYKNYGTLGRIINFDYAQKIGQTFRGLAGTTDTIPSLLNTFDTSSNYVSGGYSTVIIENHDKERDGDGNANYALSRLNSGWWYKQAQAFSILYPWGGCPLCTRATRSPTTAAKNYRSVRLTVRADSSAQWAPSRTTSARLRGCDSTAGRTFSRWPVRETGSVRAWCPRLSSIILVRDRIKSIGA